MTTIFAKLSSDGKLPIGTKEALAVIFPRYADKEISIAIEERGNKISAPQRKYYFKVIVSGFMEHFTGYSKDEMHSALMKTVGGFNNPFVNPFTGEPDESRKSLRDLTKAQAEGYFTLCRKRGAELGLNIREPNEQDYVDYDNF